MNLHYITIWFDWFLLWNFEKEYCLLNYKNNFQTLKNDKIIVTNEIAIEINTINLFSFFLNRINDTKKHINAKMP